jgi:hypothetical protein
MRTFSRTLLHGGSTDDHEHDSQRDERRVQTLSPEHRPNACDEEQDPSENEPP